MADTPVPATPPSYASAASSADYAPSEDLLFRVLSIQKYTEVFARLLGELFQAVSVVTKKKVTMESVRAYNPAKKMADQYGLENLKALKNYMRDNGTALDEDGEYEGVYSFSNTTIANMIDLVNFNSLVEYLFMCEKANEFDPFGAHPEASKSADIQSRLTQKINIQLYGTYPDTHDDRTLRNKPQTPQTVFVDRVTNGNYSLPMKDISRKYPFMSGILLDSVEPDQYGCLCILVLRDMVHAMDFFAGFSEIDIFTVAGFKKFMALSHKAMTDGIDGMWIGPSPKNATGANSLFAQILMFAPFRCLLAGVTTNTMISLLPGNGNDCVAIYPWQAAVTSSTASDTRDLLVFATKSGPGLMQQFDGFMQTFRAADE